jgi:hypothetical protein
MSLGGRLRCWAIDQSPGSLHAIVHFVPDATEESGELGMDSLMRNFASRSAPMGAVAANVVAATFYNFIPQLGVSSAPTAWGAGVADTCEAGALRDRLSASPWVLGEELAHSSEPEWCAGRAANTLRHFASLRLSVSISALRSLVSARQLLQLLPLIHRLRIQ